jgi:hypothetical protein
MKRLWMFLPLLFLFSCEDVIDVDLDDAAPRLVIDARILLNEDGTTTTQVLLTRSAPFFEEVNPPVNDAQVQIVDGNGITFQLDNQGNGLYTNTDISAQFDLDYTLQVQDQGDTFTATERLVSTVPLQNVQQEEIDGIGEFTQITAFFQDPEELGNYYLFQYMDPFNVELDISDDEFINGNLTPTSFFIEELEPGTPIELQITGIDRRAFQFFETLIQQTSDGGGGPFDTQPATVRGNITDVDDPDNFPFGYFRVSQVFELDYIAQENQ